MGNPRGFPWPGRGPLNRGRSVTVHLRMARRSAAPGSRRRHGDVRRQLRLTAWFTGAEMREGPPRGRGRTGWRPAAWLAKLGTDAAEAPPGGAQPAAVPVAGRAADVVADMSDATEVARSIGYLFNQAVAKLHSTGEHSPGLEASAAAVARAVRRMESATLRAARELLR